MRKIGFLSIALIALAAMSVTHCTFSTEDETEMSGKLEIGKAAPLFSLPGSDGNTYRLEDFLGKQAVVIAWFPKAFTGG
jgi:peroxiredoxin